MKKFIEEFKTFIAKGNVMTMAVGIIIGGAFTAIVNSLVNDVITPLLGIIIGGIDFSNIIIHITIHYKDYKPSYYFFELANTNRLQYCPIRNSK